MGRVPINPQCTTILFLPIIIAVENTGKGAEVSPQGQMLALGPRIIAVRYVKVVFPILGSLDGFGVGERVGRTGACVGGSKS
jgi:hypothetical protein